MTNLIKDILLENAQTFKERNEVLSVMESQSEQLQVSLVAKLYKSAVDKSYLDFDDIPQSKGDITKFSGYANMRESLSIIKTMAGQNNMTIPEVDTVETAINNIASHREYFVKGFLTDNNLVIMMYNSLVAACIRSTSLIVASYVEFVRDPNKIEFKLLDNKRTGTKISLEALETINAEAKKGRFTNLLKEETQVKKDHFVGNAFVASSLIVVAAVAIIPIIRELIFTFYYSRVKISDYLDHQQELIKMNRAMIESSTLSAKEKKAIIAKQQKQADKILRLSDKIRIESQKTDMKVKTEMKQESKTWTLGQVQSEIANSDSNGFGLL